MASQNQSSPGPATTNGPPASAATIPTTKASSPATSLSPQPTQQPPQLPQQSNNIDLDKGSSNTLKRNPKIELSKADLLKLLGYLEGELQARDIVIAALKSEKMKHLLTSRYLSGTSDPHAALARDVAIAGGVMGPEGNQIDQQVASLEALVTLQRWTQSRMRNVLKEAEIRHRAVIKELEEEKRKHEHDTAQGDDITYGLEKERTRLKKELELERQEKKKIEQELKKIMDLLEEERNRQKQIVLLLIAERKKILRKYVEERMRSEDLAQILSEEKSRIDSMAEGLEEESKKSLQMEAELEKQLAQFDIERQQYRQALTKEEKKTRELETELEKLKGEMEAWKESQVRGPPRGAGITPPLPPVKPANLVAMPTLRPASAPQTIKGTVLGTGTPMVSSKVVQPTATISSVPVSGPTTGIARSVTPGQALRGNAYTPTLPISSGETTTPTTTAANAPEAQAIDKRTLITSTGTAAATTPATVSTTTSSPKLSQNTTQTSKVGLHQGNPVGSISTTTTVSTPSNKKPPVSRGVPPPVPPNKPVVPPKKEAAYLRRTELSQDAMKFGKQQSIHSNAVGPVPGQTPTPHSTITTPSATNLITTTQANNEEVKLPR